MSDPSDPTSAPGVSIVKSSKHPIADDDRRLAVLIRDLSIGNYPHLKLKEPTDAEFRDIERMHRIDGLTYTQIEYMINYVAADSFWRKNIQSTAKLRQQKDRIIIEIQEKAHKQRAQVAEV